MGRLFVRPLTMFEQPDRKGKVEIKHKEFFIKTIEK